MSSTATTNPPTDHHPRFTDRLATTTPSTADYHTRTVEIFGERILQSLSLCPTETPLRSLQISLCRFLSPLLILL